MDAINAIRNLQVGATGATGAASGAAGGAGATSATGAPAMSFKDLLMKNLNEVNDLQQAADQKLDDYVTGKSNNMGEIISASQKASMAFNMLTQIRNKLQGAYDEVKNLQL